MLRLRNTNLIPYANRRKTPNQEMVNTFKGENGATFHIERVRAQNLLSEGVRLGRKGMTKYYLELKWIIIKVIKKSDN